jgi:biopolymer transport protein ExbD
MAEEQEQTASMAQVKSIIRRKLRKQPEHAEQSLNIYPLMDVMTILLVFMIMQFAAESANIVESEDLQIPYSTSTTDLQQALPITLSRSELIVDGNRIISLREGLVDASQKQGGANGFLITRLLGTMEQHKERLELIASRRGTEFTGEVQIIADERTPYRTLSEVLYTIGQAGFANIRFVVLQQGQGE